MTVTGFDLEFWRSVKGFMAEDEARTLFTIALQAASYGPVLEIGSYCGKSSVVIGSACRERGSVLFCVDHHRGSVEQQPGEEYFDPALYDERRQRIDTFPCFQDTIDRAGLSDTVVPVVASSETAGRCWGIRLAMVFIDGGHAYEDTYADYATWSGHIMTGGFLVFHDIFTDPAKGGQAPRRVYEKALADERFDFHRMVNTLAVLKRKDCI